MDHRRLLAAGATCLLGLAPLAACGGDDGEDAGDVGSSDTMVHEGGDGRDGEGGSGTTAVEIEGLETYDGLSDSHVIGDVDYPQAPPVGGDHWEMWQDCGVYDAPVMEEAAVHSLEHGAVWITYRPDLPSDQVALAEAYGEQPYVLVSPWDEDADELAAPVVLTAWGAQLPVESLPSPEADLFVETYRSGPTAPEPDAPCTGALALTAEEYEAQVSR
jgi:hypothetical protein